MLSQGLPQVAIPETSWGTSGSSSAQRFEYRPGDVLLWLKAAPGDPASGDLVQDIIAFQNDANTVYPNAR
jgi:hypothetical protein